jgi:hypothetical protein
MIKSNIEKDTWYDLYDKEHVMPNTIPDDTTLMLLLENDEIVRYDSDWDDKYPFSLVTHWKLVVKE